MNNFNIHNLFRGQVKNFKRDFKKMIDEMSDEEFMDLLSMLVLSTDAMLNKSDDFDDYDDDDWEEDYSWGDMYENDYNKYNKKKDKNYKKKNKGKKNNVKIVDDNEDLPF